MTETSEMRDRVLVELTIAAPADAVWDALRDPAKIYNWFGWDADSLRDEIDFIFFKHVIVDDAARILRFDGMPDRFEVEERDGKSVLRIVRSVAADEGWEGVYEDMTEGWISFVEQFRLGIEHHGLGARRTLYLAGSAIEGVGPPSRELGLSAVVDAPPGSPVSAALPTGDAVDGVVWHRTPFQFGVTVPGWGDGLLIVTDVPEGQKSPHGRGTVVLTTYGLADADFAALEARWRQWWDARYAPSADAACG